MRAESSKHLRRGKSRKWDTAGVLLAQGLTGRPIDFAEVFGNTRPVEIEIGTGKGAFLLARAAGRPDLNFLGIERARTYCDYAADRFRRAGLSNIRMLCTEAADVFRKCLGESCIWRVHIYFPDPWPKRRHHRRRSIRVAFLKDVHRTLRPGGQVIIVTDHFNYFEHIRRVLANTDGFLTVAFPSMTDKNGQLVGTNFERKYIAQGRLFYNTALMKYV